jgi:outer membrane lipoprotein LolB
MAALRALALVAAMLLLGACATHPPHRGAGPAWPERLAALRAIDHFGFSGRMAVNTGSEGFSAGLRWNEHGDDASVDLQAPLGFGAAHIERGGGVLHVTTGRGESLDADAAAAELAAQLGFDPPLDSLRYWVLGASDPGSEATETVDAQQRLAHLEQNGWRIDYADYAPVPPYSLPGRVTLQRAGVQMRLVINSWRL